MYGIEYIYIILTLVHPVRNAIEYLFWAWVFLYNLQCWLMIPGVGHIVDTIVLYKDLGRNYMRLIISFDTSIKIEQL